MPKKMIQLKVNGELYEVMVEPRRKLVDVIRDEMGLTGTKKGCETGYCGACTILMDGKPFNSCLVLAIDVQGKNIITVEGLAAGERLHPLQESFIEHGAFQCGFCTPGMLMISKALLNENPNPTEEEVRTYISGNLCRCTGYVKIVEAILAVAGRQHNRYTL